MTLSTDQQKRVRKLRERDGDGCFFCGRPVDFAAKHNQRWALSIHHHLPKRDGGTNEIGNLRLTHCRCHRQHHLDEAKQGVTASTFGYPTYWERGILEVTPGRERLGL